MDFKFFQSGDDFKYFKLNEFKRKVKRFRKRVDFKKKLIKNWEKIISNKYTKLFAITTIIQCIAIVILQAIILSQNLKLYGAWGENKSAFQNSTNHDSTCAYLSDKNVPKFPFITLDNIIFIFFQVFQLYFCFNALFKEHVIQLIAINILNFGWSAYGFVQIYEVLNISNDLNNFADCLLTRGLHTSQDFMYLIILDVSCAVFLLILSIFVAYLSFKLNDQFGWNIYKKHGGDLNMQAIYKDHLTFIMLLKLNLLATVLFLIASILASEHDEFSSFITTPVLIFHYFVTALVLILEITGYKLVEIEHKTGMIVFLVLWLAVIADFILVLIGLIYVFKIFGSFWIFGIILVILLILNSILLLAFGFKVLNNFGKGLKELLQREPGQPMVPVNQLNHIWDLDYDPNKITIDT